MTSPTESNAPDASLRTPAPFGTWPSPITTELIVGATIRLGQPLIDAHGVVWTEGRPTEQGRNALVYRASPALEVATDSPVPAASASNAPSAGPGSAPASASSNDAGPAPVDLMPAPFNTRSLVHEYGGGSCVMGAGAVWFVQFSDQQIYRLDLPTDAALHEPVQITHAQGMRFADLIVDTHRQRLICVAEDHRDTSHEAVNSLVAIDINSGTIESVAQGHDFFSSPTLSADGRCLAWLSWEHPNMPWDGTQLWLAELDSNGTPGPARCIAGGPAESICQPAWSPSGELHFVSDRSGWWNLYRVDYAGRIESMHAMEAEFGTPQWQFGSHTYGFDARGCIVCLYQQDGDTRLAVLDGTIDTRAQAAFGVTENGAATTRFETIATPFRSMRDIRVHGHQAVFVGSSPTENEALVLFDLDTRTHRVLRESSSARPDPADVSIAQAIRFPTEAGLEAHALFYPPANARYTGAPGTLPPLLVFSHGGPTSATHAGFKWSIQYWTSRGFAVVDVNYGGSSGYGREYRSRLNGSWGVVDVDDCVNAARYLVDQKRVDGDRVAIRGGSAGGYTTLSALTFRDFFKAGASHYGIGDLEALARDTHKFESRYLDRLVGPYPEDQAVYRARSPIAHTDRLSSAMILFQGAEDKAVPPNQAQAMFDAVRAKGLPVAYLLFENEQHGFRRAETIRRVYDAELYFYGKVFGFTPADAVEPVVIENL
jgi:dipeptidyl aminopeptidase/acylaminoacyl peptidase